jgi:hypothetical protein
METKLERLKKATEARGFTEEYQKTVETKENVISSKKRSPATNEVYDRAMNTWKL